MITRDQAYEKLTELLSNPNLVKHCLAAEAAMAAYADHFNISDQETELWKIAGLLHDADWEKFPEQHPNVIIDWLKDRGEPEELLNAIAAHGWEFGVEPQTLMARVLRASDELTGLITAVALVKGRNIDGVTVDSIMKKWPKKDFAGGVKREDIEKGAQDINVPLEQHIEIVLKGMKSIKKDLGL